MSNQNGFSALILIIGLVLIIIAAGVIFALGKINVSSPKTPQTTTPKASEGLSIKSPLEKSYQNPFNEDKESQYANPFENLK